MAGLLSGLEKFGLGGLENVDLFEDEKAKTVKAEEVKKTPQEIESEMLFEKTFVCPICDAEFKNKTVKVGKAKLLGTDLDLRPKYEHIDVLKYDVIICPECGYAALSRYFKFITTPQAKLIRENISAAFKGIPETGEVYTYEEALFRYKLSLANAVVKRARSSEKAYICLKSAWLIRGQAESLDEKEEGYQKKKKECEQIEREFLENALDGFLTARQTEVYPMCGMDEATVDFLIAVLAMNFGKYEISTKLISSIMGSTTANPRMKDKARDIKDILMKKIKEQKSKQ